MLIVLPLVRADHVDAFEGGAPAKTPNLNDLTKESLRFDRAIPESMPALSARRALVTGMRAYPFRDWRRLEGFPSVPGFNPVWDHQPLLMEQTRAAGIETVYVTDNPVFAGDRFQDVRRPGGPTVTTEGGLGTGIDEELLASFHRQTLATRRTFRAGAQALAELEGDESFFVGIDPFDPSDAYFAPPFYVKPGRAEADGLGPTDGRLVELNFGDREIDRVREAYVKHVEAVDEELGRLLDEVPGDAALIVIGDHGLALGEHGYIGRAAPTSHRISYEIPFLIRHPDGQEKGNDVDWYATTHDVAPTILSFLDVPIPGKMRGEDLTALFDDVDEDDMPDRPKSLTAVGLADHHPRPPLARGGRPRADHPPDVRRRRGGRGRHHALRQHRERGHRQAHGAVPGRVDRLGRHAARVRPRRGAAPAARAGRRRHGRRRHPERLRPVRQRRARGRHDAGGPRVRRTGARGR